MDEADIDQLRHDLANSEQRLRAAKAQIVKALGAIEMKEDGDAKRLLRNLLAALDE